MRRDVGIQAAGRMYVIGIRNGGKAPVSVDARALSVRDAAGKQWDVQWLEQASKPESVSTMGKLRLAQSKHSFDLGVGEERQLYVFIPSAGDALPPSAEDLVSGSLSIAGGLQVNLTHTEMKAVQQ